MTGTKEKAVWLPNVIHGDLDSLRSDAREYYERNGVKVVRDDDQYSTDFMKCLKYINKKSDTLSVFLNSATHPSIPVDVVAVGGLGGRVDQGLSQIHHLYAASNDPNLQLGDVYLLSPESISFVLRQGRNVVYTPDVKESTSTFSRGEILSENVGIVPIGRPAVITTKGFEWDVSNWKTEFGGQISTSNHIKNKVVEVETSESILFTVELASLE
ncbi:MAG: hypothetical protein M1827_001863 [Pycnora praestabilis]|nr:MAG: hypothetical protein M1827_001863 [Pycnora praestabilis]